MSDSILHPTFQGLNFHFISTQEEIEIQAGIYLFLSGGPRSFLGWDGVVICETPQGGRSEAGSLCSAVKMKWVLYASLAYWTCDFMYRFYTLTLEKWISEVTWMFYCHFNCLLGVKCVLKEAATIFVCDGCFTAMQGTNKERNVASRANWIALSRLKKHLRY